MRKVNSTRAVDETFSLITCLYCFGAGANVYQFNVRAVLLEIHDRCFGVKFF